MKLAGDAVVNVYINHEKKFAFVEMRTVEEASNAMALDGIIFEASNLGLFTCFHFSDNLHFLFFFFKKKLGLLCYVFSLVAMIYENEKY